MKFKTKYKVENRYIKKKYKFRSKFRDIKIKIEPFNDNSKHQSVNSLCTIISTLEPNKRVREVFENLHNRKIPQGVDPDELNGVDKNGNIIDIDILPFSSLPEPFKSFVNEILSGHKFYSYRLIKTLFWRLDLVGSHDPLKERQSEYSYNGKDWDVIPIDPIYDVEVIRPLTLTEHVIDEITKIISEDNTQPISHELFREAWGLRSNNNRSSLVIAIAAAEIGIKKCIATLVPDSEWILMNMASPSIIKILKEYLPTILNKNTILASDILIDKIHKGVTKRNKIIHSYPQEISYESLIDILIAVKDLLWILDYYSGFDWALDNIEDKQHIKN